MPDLIYDPPQPQVDDSDFVISRKTDVNISRIADAIGAGVSSGLSYDPPQPQTDDNALVIDHKTAVNVSRVADLICLT